MRVRLHRSQLWELHALDLPTAFMTARELEHPAANYLCGFGTEEKAREWAAGQGWEVVG